MSCGHQESKPQPLCVDVHWESVHLSTEGAQLAFDLSQDVFREQGNCSPFLKMVMSHRHSRCRPQSQSFLTVKFSRMVTAFHFAFF